MYIWKQIIIQKYREVGSSQLPNVCLWDDFPFRVMLLSKKIIAALHIGRWQAYQSFRAALLPVLYASDRHDCLHFNDICIVAT